MIQQLQMFRTFVLAMNAKRKSEEGATAVEYGLMVAAIAAIIVVVVFAIGKLVGGAFDTTQTGLEDGGVVSR
jgi:pilus assembly protein Flp/PilA